MIERKVKTVRALERGLDVLAEIERRGRGAGRNPSRAASGARPAQGDLLRMVVTLGKHGHIWQRLATAPSCPATSARRGPTRSTAALPRSPRAISCACPSSRLAFGHCRAAARSCRDRRDQQQPAAARRHRAGPCRKPPVLYHTSTGAPIWPRATRASARRSSSGCARTMTTARAGLCSTKCSPRRARAAMRCASLSIPGRTATGRRCGRTGAAPSPCR